VGIATTVLAERSGARIPLGEEYFYIFQGVQIGFGVHPVSCSMGSGVLSQGREVNRLTSSSAESMNEWSLYLYSPQMPSCRGQGKRFFYLCMFCWTLLSSRK
jgi:hypothetical protein